MNKNNFFSISRFALLLRNDFLLNYKKYLLTLLGTLIVMYLIIYFQLSSYASIDFPYSSSDLMVGQHMVQYFIAFSICLIGLGLFLGMSFPAFSSKADTQSYLLLPASTFEKYLSQVFIRIILGTGLFFLTFWLAAFLVRSTFLCFPKTFLKINIFEFSDMFLHFIDGMDDALTFCTILFIFVFLGVYMFSVRLYFKKLAVVKTAISIVAVIFLSVMLLQLFMFHIYPKLTGSDFQIHEYLLTEHHTNTEVYFFVVISLSWLFFLPLSYFKLKEKQI